MRHRKYTFKIGRTSAHRKAMLANMVSSLIREGRIRTTLVKAKEARRLADKMVTLAKRGDLHARRRAISTLRDKGAVALLFSDAGQFEQRRGGYTRIYRLGPRVGDAAEMALLEWVTEPVPDRSAAPAPEAQASSSSVEEAPAADAAEEVPEEAAADQSSVEQSEPDTAEAAPSQETDEEAGDADKTA